MRPTALLLAALALGGTGCSALVACGGTEVGGMSRAQVQDTFGPPLLVTPTAGGGTVEAFTTRRKIAERWKVQGYCLLGFWTCGLSELVSLPVELGRAAEQVAIGQRLEVEYDALGRLVVVRRNGKTVGWPRNYDEPTVPPEPYTPGSATRATTTGTARFTQPASGIIP